MRKLLNTLYITTSDAYLSKDGMNVVVSVDKEELFRIPIINVESIVTFGYMGASPGLMKLCMDNNVSLSFSYSTGTLYLSGSRSHPWKCTVAEEAVLHVGK